MGRGLAKGGGGNDPFGGMAEPFDRPRACTGVEGGKGCPYDLPNPTLLDTGLRR